MSLCERLAEYLKARPGQWMNGYDLMKVGGSFAFRTRISELRHAPYRMTIENKVERHAREEAGTVKHWTETYYRFVPVPLTEQPTPFSLDETDRAGV